METDRYTEEFLKHETKLQRKITRRKILERDMIFPNIQGEYRVCDGVNIIGDGCFSEQNELTSVILPEGLEEIRDNAFYRCERLRYIKFPISLKRIGKLAFSNCPLCEAILPLGIESIGEGAFFECPLESINFRDTLTYIGKDAFKFTRIRSAIQD